MSEPFDISDYLLGEMEPSEQRRAEKLMAEDEALRLRVEALASVCSRLEAAPDEAWEPPEPPALEEAALEESAPAEEESQKPQRPRRRRSLLPRPLAAGVLAAGLIGVGFGAGLLVEGDGGEGESFGVADDETAERIELNPIASLDPSPSGTVLISGEGSDRRAELSATGLPVSERVLYELWLLDSARGQMSLGTFAPDSGGEAKVAMPMPVTHEAYTYVDVSREPRDGDPAHSGASILRAPTGP